MRKWIFISILALSAIVCNLGSPQTPTPLPPTEDVALAVNATLTAVSYSLTATAAVEFIPSPTLSPTPTDFPSPTPFDITATPTLSNVPMSSFPDTGYISGSLSYPDLAAPPALRVAVFEIMTGQVVVYTDTVAGQDTYTIEVPVGSYHVIAYTLGGSGIPGGLVGPYEYADALVDVVVTSGATTVNVSIDHFFGPDGTFPAMPGQ